MNAGDAMNAGDKDGRRHGPAPWLDAASLMEAYGEGRLDPVGVVDEHLARIEESRERLGAWLDLAVDRARAQARESRERWARSAPRPLEGVPFGVKANLAVEGLPWHAGVGALAGRRAQADALVVRRLREAGAIVLGLLNMHEAALGATTANRFFGVTHNPHRRGFTAAGSSGGSGAAVAAGTATFALGTDTLGSVRLPAAVCGVFGLKPTPDAVPRDGLELLVERWDTIGPLARTAGDCWRAFAVMAGRAGEALDHGDWPGLRVALPSSVDEVALHPAVAAAWRVAADALAGLGARVERVSMAIDHHRVRLAGFIEAAREADLRLGEDVRARPDLYSPEFAHALAFGRAFGLEAVATGRRQLHEAAIAWSAPLQLYEMLLVPTTPQPAFALAGEAPVNQADLTALANIAGLPALSLPAGWTDDGLPVGVQLVGRPGDEARLCRLGERLDQTLGAWAAPDGFR